MNACDKKTLTKILGKLITKLTNKTGGTTKKPTKKTTTNPEKNTKKTTTDPKISTSTTTTNPTSTTTTNPTSTTTTTNPTSTSTTTITPKISPEGTVKWYNKDKGFGFITPDKGDIDIFVHYSQIQGNGYKELKENQRVQYEITTGNKGPEANSVKVV